MDMNFKIFPYYLIFLLKVILVIGQFVSSSDFTLTCNRGYRVSAIRRTNSPHQKGKTGSLIIECQTIQRSDLELIRCETLDSAPQCNGLPEGCGESQWLAGFQVYAIENSTNAHLLDPICCSSPKVRIDTFSCASERVNTAQMPFEHTILANDLVYRGMQCWHQYDSKGTILDMVWKMEICQFQYNFTPARSGGQKHSLAKQMAIRDEIAQSSPENCPPCSCHCGIDLCGNGAEPVRVVHKTFDPKKCSCDCLCKYECI